jgi:hypothetical protein
LTGRTIASKSVAASGHNHGYHRGMYSARTAVAIRRVHDHARLQVRAGFLDAPAVLADVTAVAADEDLEGPDGIALAAVEQARAGLLADQRRWPAVTDVDRLRSVFGALRGDGIVVLEGVPDHWAATAELERLDDTDVRPAGIAWFTRTDVWHAIDHGMLEINLWQADSANVAPGDSLLADALGRFDEAGLSAVFDEGRIEVRARWHRRPVALDRDVTGDVAAPAEPLR